MKILTKKLLQEKAHASVLNLKKTNYKTHAGAWGGITDDQYGLFFIEDTISQNGFGQILKVCNTKINWIDLKTKSPLVYIFVMVISCTLYLHKKA